MTPENLNEKTDGGLPPRTGSPSSDRSMVRLYASQVQTLADIIIGGENVPAPFYQVQERLADILRDRDAMRDWIMQAAPMLSVASCIMIDEAVERLGEIEGCRAVLELCPVDFINPENDRAMPSGDGVALESKLKSL